MVIENRQVKLSRTCKYGHQDDDASLAGIFDRLAHGNVVACAIIDHVRLIRSEVMDHSLTEVLIPGIDTKINSALLSLFQAEAADIGDHHLVCSHSFGCLGHQYADGSCSQNRDLCPFHIPRPSHCMDGDSQGLDHGAFVITHLIRQRGNLCLVNSKVMGGNTGGLKPHNLKFLTQIVFAVAAWIAAAADHLGLDSHLLPRLYS